MLFRSLNPERDPNLSGMPEAVRITLWVESDSRSKTATAPENEAPEPPLKFQTVARLNLAAASSGSSGNGSSDNSGQATPGTTDLGRN